MVFHRARTRPPAAGCRGDHAAFGHHHADRGAEPERFAAVAAYGRAGAPLRLRLAGGAVLLRRLPGGDQGLARKVDPRSARRSCDHRPGRRQVCPPQVTGQLPLLPRLPRTFTRQHGYRLAARDFPEWADVLQAVERVRVRRGLSAGWCESVVQMMRLALASREASEQLVDDYVVAELPRMRPAVAEVLREARLLRR
ncbi:hypothetical protein [Streptomyces sp. NPDC048196]|uniref:hypothetical protein n=1 Tax=Streptomyces sp. NPDC048196 TaxID=3154712 RepID=UPI00340D2961